MGFTSGKSSKKMSKEAYEATKVSWKKQYTWEEDGDGGMYCSNKHSKNDRTFTLWSTKSYTPHITELSPLLFPLWSSYEGHDDELVDS